MSKVDDLQKRIKSFADSENEDIAKALNVTVEQLKERTEILQETLAYYNQQLQALRKHDSLLQEKQALQDRIATGEALKLEESPPYSLKFYDDFNVRLAENQRNLETALLAVSVSERALRDAKDRFKEAGVKIRQLKSDSAQLKDHQAVLQNQWLLEQAERDEGLAGGVTGYQELALTNAREEAELAAIRANLNSQVRERIRENLHFDPADLDKQLAAIDEQKRELQERSDAIRKNLRQANREVDKVQKKVERAQGENEINKVKATLDVAEQWRQTYRIQLEQVENIIQQLSTRKQLWKQRYDLIKGAIERKEFTALKEGAVKQRDRLQQSLALEQERQTSLQLQIGKLEEQLRQEGLSWDAKGNLNEQRNALVGLVNSTINFITALNHTNQMNLRFIDELESARRSLSLAEMVSVTIARLQGWWKAELFVIDDQPLTLGTITTSLVILILGIILTGFVSRLLQKRLLVRLNISASSAAIAGKLVHYIILILVVLFAMRIVNIPLTAFTFFGGAIAIGVGFGAQKLINNFISCFIIMAEQPIRVGDLIMMDNEQCWIEDIGARCTKVRTYSNINILVPNSYFLENNITNWTHSDNIVRGKVTVGVAYGSPTRTVKEELLKAAAEHGEVRKHPEPYVFFGDFGDNALVFELYYWVTVTQSVGIQRISSDLRFMVDERLRDAGITIAFPQRDLHFDSGKPLQIELSRAKPGKEKE
ncbi:MAG: mechanosensitive ion channel [Proteobacteria bacterium]|nr:mechanosensitive ion channel [Pseudomonadota bacterium]MBU1739670.1 mechanosensitive ion channel [Pseudomonadota bacterium]